MPTAKLQRGIAQDLVAIWLSIGYGIGNVGCVAVRAKPVVIQWCDCKCLRKRRLRVPCYAVAPFPVRIIHDKRWINDDAGDVCSPFGKEVMTE